MDQSKHEWEDESYERFHRGDSEANTKTGDEALEAYARIRRGFRDHPVPGYDTQKLAKTMFDAAARNQPAVRWSARFDFLWNNALTLASGVAIVLCAIVLGGGFLSLRTDGIDSVRFYDSESQAENESSWLWTVRLRMGNLVTVPPLKRSEIVLKDGSTLSAFAGAQIAISFDRERRVRLNQGVLQVWAKKKEGMPMVVYTPLAKVTVTGTVFKVEVLP